MEATKTTRAEKKRILDTAHIVLQQHIEDMNLETLLAVAGECVAVLVDDSELRNKVRKRCGKPPYRPKGGQN